MSFLISKSRAKKTKSREKAPQKTLWQWSMRESPYLGVLITFLTWLLVVLISNFEILKTRTCSYDTILPMLGNATFLLIGTITAGIFLSIARSKAITSNSSLLFTCSVVLMSITAGKAVLYFSAAYQSVSQTAASFFMPFALGPLLIAMLLDPVTAVVAGLYISLAFCVMAGHSIPVLLAGVAASAVASHMGSNIRTRAKLFRAGTVVGLSQVLCIFGLTTLEWNNSDHNVMSVIHNSFACVAGGFVSSVLAMLILPVFENIFDLTSNITLLELSDMGHPLLQRLALEAPGTYHHSLVTANLAQSAAQEVGAKALLARVGAYYHDIGKLTKPSFFAENIQGRENPHNDLSPSMSTLIISSHIKEGVSLALIHKMPTVIITIIKEHHGTGLISYFHHKAKAQLEFELAKSDPETSNGNTKINDSDFRYPGPKPTSLESVIVSLADAVEAASRTMEKVSPAHIENLVGDIINVRVEDGQFSEAHVTLADLGKIERSFVFSLTNMLHARIPYPKDEDRDKQQAKAPENQQAGNKEID